MKKKKKTDGDGSAGYIFCFSFFSLFCFGLFSFFSQKLRNSDYLYKTRVEKNKLTVY